MFIKQYLVSMPLLTLIRHGQSTYNLENRFTGSLDVPLTSLGIQEAHQAGSKLKGFTYSAAYTSMLKRAQNTLQIILEEIKQTGIPIIQNAALDERMYGSLQGLNKAETILKYGEAQVDVWRRSFAVRPPDGESLEDTFNRAIPYYKSTIEPALKANQNILVAAHGNSLRALMMYLESIDTLAIAKVNIPTGSPRNYILDNNLKVKSVSYL
jgi:2,3-bisphosphoglycerate-dependent phosphoglycerate mutase